MNNGNYMIVWKFEKAFAHTKELNNIQYLYIKGDTLTIPNTCLPYYVTTPDKVKNPTIIKSNNKIKASYHNPKGYDLIIYDDNTIVYIGWGEKIGKIIPVENNSNNENKNINILSKIHNKNNTCANSKLHNLIAFIIVAVIILGVIYFITKKPINLYQLKQ
jgi:hypothetical protein